MIRSVILIIFISCTLGIGVTAAGLSYGDDQIFSHGYIDFDRAGALALTEYPFADIDSQMTFQTSYRQLYNIRELADNRAALAVRRDEYTYGIALASFGKPDYFHQTGFASYVSWRRDEYTFGASLIYRRISFSSIYDYLSFYTANIGAAYRKDRYRVFMVTRAINQPRYYPGEEPLRPQFECGLSFKTEEGLDNQVKALFVKFEKPTAELSQSFQPAAYARINWALVLSPVRFGTGLNLNHGRFEFGYRFSHHPVLGATHTVLLTVNK